MAKVTVMQGCKLHGFLAKLGCFENGVSGAKNLSFVIVSRRSQWELSGGHRELRELSGGHRELSGVPQGAEWGPQGAERGPQGAERGPQSAMQGLQLAPPPGVFPLKLALAASMLAASLVKPHHGSDVTFCVEASRRVSSMSAPPPAKLRFE
ncbi:unnamed protein product [Boreogadus saida]